MNVFEKLKNFETRKMFKEKRKKKKEKRKKKKEKRRQSKSMCDVIAM
jgi:hypothetical protein